MPDSILNFDNYIDFLKKYYEDRKKACYGFSYASWAKQLNLNSKSLLYMVAQGKRLPSPDFQKLLCDYFEFNDRERNYFYDLVELRKSKINRVDNYNRVIERMQQNRTEGKSRKLNSEEFFQFNEWQTQTIFNLSRSPLGLPNDAHKIKSALIGEVTLENIQNSIETLLKLDLCEIKNDRLHATCDQIETTHDIPSESIRKYHRQALQGSIDSLSNTETQKRSITGGSLLTSTQNLELIKERIRSFELELFRDFEDNSGTEVYQFSTSLYPLGELTND